ncbi:protein phosphatase 2C domain-containing protein [Mycoplasma sp. SG1]|uniref:protein phosphatase 2C domain-containing protein n=1 Tax=Mycoplasma sp. SG1 TaxID=2810348 RepID=UPI002024535B|nr:protein phosphatase 2C domain-containing protein [Mycoplasma sp. SG1]URM53142.1 protein phosphatase 2C domain-containing protein [Mycoplasma sp. SG1]
MYLLGIAAQYCGKFRKENQDYSTFVFNKNGINLCAIADGMGGHYGSKNASKLALEILKTEFLKFNISQTTEIDDIQKWIVDVCKNIKKEMIEFCQKNTTFYDMGTTLNFTIIQNDKIFAVNIGDSRTYFTTQKSIIQLSKDQNILNEKNEENENSNLFKDLSKNILANSLTSALGPNKKYIVQIKLIENVQKGWLLLCTDGIYSVVDDRSLLATIIRPINLFSKIESLINQAFVLGSKDNCSAVMIKIEN